MSPPEAIYEGCLIRFRPIMMTTMAALLGGVPIALGYGAGGEVAAAAGHGGGGRPGVFAVDDALSDTGGVYLHGGDRGPMADGSEIAGKAWSRGIAWQEPDA